MFVPAEVPQVALSRQAIGTDVLTVTIPAAVVSGMFRGVNAVNDVEMSMEPYPLIDPEVPV
jgi:hypothetical protein